MINKNKKNKEIINKKTDTLSVSKSNIEELKSKIEDNINSTTNADELKKAVETTINNFTENLTPSVKKLNIKRLQNSFKNSIEGLKFAYTNESSLIILTLFDIFFIILGIWCQISRLEWIFVVIMIITSFAAELLNTSIEKTVDLVTREYHPLAKIAKDTGSAAEFVYDIMLFIMACIIFLPHIFKMFNLFQ